jgi:hypothetical protein
MGAGLPADSILAEVVDLPTIFGSTNPFVGFSAATGAAFNDQDILNWEFRDTFNPIITPLGAVPEPSTYGLLGGAALLGLAAIRRRKSKA